MTWANKNGPLSFKTEKRREVSSVIAGRLQLISNSPVTGAGAPSEKRSVGLAGAGRLAVLPQAGGQGSAGTAKYHSSQETDPFNHSRVKRAKN